MCAHEVASKQRLPSVQVQISEMEALMQLLQSDADREVRRVQEQMSELEVLGAVAAVLILVRIEVNHDIVKICEDYNLKSSEHLI